MRFAGRFHWGRPLSLADGVGRVPSVKVAGGNLWLFFDEALPKLAENARRCPAVARDGATEALRSVGRVA